jgi:DNA polymerase V
MHSLDAIPHGSPVGSSQPTSASPPRTGVSAGFGSPGTDATVKRIDLNDALIRHPQATFTMRAAGSAMHEAGIDDGDVLLVDRALQPLHGQVVIAVVDGEFLCRRLWQQGRVSKLQAADPMHADIVPGDGVQLEVWGVVTTVIKSVLD